MRISSLIFTLIISTIVLSGCSEMKNYVGPKEIPVWLVIRQINGVERDYELNREESLEAVKYAITSQGGTVRYFTEVGTSRTLYGKTADGEGIIVDIDPYYKKPRLTEIDVSVTMYGDKEKANKLHTLIEQYKANQTTSYTTVAKPQQSPAPEKSEAVIAEAKKTTVVD